MIPGLAEAIGAVASSIGDAAIEASARKEDNRVAQEIAQANLAVQDKWARKNIQMQREFAQHGIRWKTEDAKRAGIHPVVALGGGGASFSPISVGSVDQAHSSPGHAFSDIGSKMGQNISRAIKATVTENERQQLEMNELQLENMKLQNSLLGQRLTAGSNQPSQIGPAIPVEKAIQPETTWHKTQSGSLAPAPSEAFADRAEDQFLPQIGWAIRNMFMPVAPQTKPSGWPKTRWFYNPVNAEWFEARPSDVPWHLKTYDSVRRGLRGSP